MIYNAGSNYPAGGGNFGSFNLSGNAQFNVTAPTSGAYTGIVLFQSRDNTVGLVLSGEHGGKLGGEGGVVGGLLEGSAQEGWRQKDYF